MSGVTFPGNRNGDGTTGDPEGGAFVGDVNYDGVLDVVTISYPGFVNGDSKIVVWTPETGGILLETADIAANWVSSVAIANVYDDTQDGHATDMREIIIGKQNVLFAYNPQYTGTVWSYATTEASSGTNSLLLSTLMATAIVRLFIETKPH